MEYDKKSVNEKTARLVLGYLKTDCRSAYKIFLKSKFPNKGQHIVTRVAGQNLTDILKVYGELYEIIQSRLEETNFYREKSRDYASPYNLAEQLIYLLEHNVSCTPGSTPCPRSPSDSIAPSIALDDENPLSVQSNCPPSSSEVETTPENELPGNAPQCNSENSYFCKTPKRKPASPKATKSADKVLPMPETDVKEVMSEVTQTLLKNTEFHKKIAENINFVLNGSDLNLDLDEDELKDLASTELDAKIQNVMRKTEEDPSFDKVVQTLLVNTPIAQSISKVLEEHSTPTTSNVNHHQTNFEPSKNEYLQNTGPTQIYSSASSIISATTDCSNPNNVIVYNGSLENYVKTAETAGNMLATPTMQSVQNPLYVNTNNMVLIPQSVAASNYQYANQNNKQIYVVNQPIMMQSQPQNNCLQPVNRQLTEEEILAMPTVILNETTTQNVNKAVPVQLKPVYPKVKVEIARNIKDYINFYDVNKESPDIKMGGLKNVLPPKSTVQTLTNNPKELPKLDLEQPSTSSTNTDKTNSEKPVKSVEIIEPEKNVQKPSQCGGKSIPNIHTPSPARSASKKQTPKSGGSHVRTLTFSPLKVRSTSGQKKINQAKSPNFIHKKQAAKTLFKSAAKENIKQNSKTKESAKQSKQPWDCAIRAQLGVTNENETMEKKKATPGKAKKRQKEKKIVKRQLNTTDQDGLLIESALKSPDAPTDEAKNTKKEQPIKEINTVLINDVNMGDGLKKILSPSKLHMNKKILKTEANVSSTEDKTPVAEKEKTSQPVNAKRIISFLPDTTPIKEDFYFKTDLTPGFSTLTPMTQLLKANGINDSLGIDTPNFPLTPGTFLTQEPSPYYEPEEKLPDPIEEELLDKSATGIKILSDVTVKPPNDVRKEKNGIALSDHLRKFNHNIIGKKNLNLMNREEQVSDMSSEEESSGEMSVSEEEATNATVICTKAVVHVEKLEVNTKQCGYSLRARKKSVEPIKPDKDSAEEKPKSVKQKAELQSSGKPPPGGKPSPGKPPPEANSEELKVAQSNFIKEVLSTIDTKENKHRLTTPKKKILSELEAKKLRVLQGLKNDTPKSKRANEEKIKEPPKKNKQMRGRKRKSASPRKNTKKQRQSVENEQKSDDGINVDTGNQVDEPEASVNDKNERGEEKNDSMNENKLANESFFPVLSSDEDDDDKKEQLIAFRERGIGLVPNKSPKKKTQKDIETIEVAEKVNDVGLIDTASCKSVALDFSVISQPDGTDLHIVFDETKRITKKFEEYDIKSIEKIRIIEIETDLGDVDVKLTCTPFDSLLDIPSEMSPKRIRPKPVGNVDNKVKKIREKAAKSTEENEQKPELGGTEKNVCDNGPQKLARRNSGKSEAGEDVGNSCESGKDSLKSGKKRKHRTESTSSNSEKHMDKKTKSNNVDASLFKNIDIPSFLNKIHT